MLSSTALIWTIAIAAVCWLIAIGQLRALYKSVGDGSAQRRWSVAQGKITISKLGTSPTHPSGLDPAEAGAMMRYHYRVGAKDYEGDGFKIGGKTRAGGLVAKALIKQYPEGRDVDVYYDPADPAHSSLEEKGSVTKPTIFVFFIVFAAIGGILTAHAIAGKMIMMSNGLPMFALGLPSAALLVAVGAFVAYFNQRRDFKASASWPAIPGKIISSDIIEDTETRRDDDGRETESTTYRPDIRFAYSIGGADYATDTWKLGGIVGSGSPKYAQGVIGRFPAGQAVTVYYNPASPDVAVLDPANRDGAWMPLIFGVAFGLAGVGFMWLFTHGHWVNAATGT
jgi:hypothetical protein